MRRSLIHPRRNASTSRMYVFLASVGKIDTAGVFTAASGLTDLPALYDADAGTGSEPRGMTVDAPASHEIRVIGWRRGIASGMNVVLTWPDRVTEKRFKISSVAPTELSSRTIMTVTPIR